MSAVLREFLAAFRQAPRMYFAPLIAALVAVRTEADRVRSELADPKRRQQTAG